MQQWLFRYEASNFDNTVFDLQQLSAIRGASLTYLYSSDLVKRVLVGKLGEPNVNEIYGGASQGVYVLEASELTAKASVENVKEALSKSDMLDTGCHQHMSYVTALVPCGDGELSEALLKTEAICSAKGRQNKLPLPSFGLAQDKPGEKRDPRPACAGKKQSQEVIDRLRFGREQRQVFYEQKLPGNKCPLFNFTDEFEEITKFGNCLGADGEYVGPDDGQLPVSLRNKMAVFFADGNKFGNHRKNAIQKDTSLGKLKAFSSDLLNKQSALLDDIIKWLESHYKPGCNNAWFYRPDGQDDALARFETLLWGGDELIFVMPSWLALDFAELFFKSVQGWEINGNSLTFSAGLVICDRKTPIRQAKEVAEKLAKKCKYLMDPSGDAFGINLMQIEIFESLTLPTGDMTVFRDRLYYQGHPVEGKDEKEQEDKWKEREKEINLQLSILGGDVDGLVERISKLKGAGGYPRSQLYKLLEAASKDGTAYSRNASIVDGKDDQKKREEHGRLDKIFETYKNRAGAEKTITKADLRVLKPLDDKPAAFALDIAMIAQLWDYVRPFEAIAEGRANQ